MKKENRNLETNLIYAHACNYCKCFCLTLHRKSGKHKTYVWYRAYQHAYYNRSLSALDNEQMDLLHATVLVLLQADWLASKDTAKAVYTALNKAYYKTYIPSVEKWTDEQQQRHNKTVKKALSQRFNSAQRQALKTRLDESLIKLATPTQCKAIIAVLNDRYSPADEKALRRLGYKLDIPDIQPPTPVLPTPTPPKPHNLLCIRPKLTAVYGNYEKVRAVYKKVRAVAVGAVPVKETNKR